MNFCRWSGGLLAGEPLPFGIPPPSRKAIKNSTPVTVPVPVPVGEGGGLLYMSQLYRQQGHSSITYSALEGFCAVNTVGLPPNDEGSG